MMQRVLLLSDSDELTAVLKRSLGDGGFAVAGMVALEDNLCMSVARNQSDIVVAIMARSSKKVLEAIHQLTQQHSVPVVMFIKEGDENVAAEATRAGVSACVIDGLREDRVKPILTAAVTRFRETQALREELDKAQTSLKERKLIERAKGLLIKQRHCSEDEAYTALRKLAMEKNKRLSEIAEGVINAASLMN